MLDITHPRIRYHPWRLHLDDLLHELDATYSDTCRPSIPPLEYVRLYRCHLVPDRDVVRIRNTSEECIVRQIPLTPRLPHTSTDRHPKAFLRNRNQDYTYM